MGVVPQSDFTPSSTELFKGIALFTPGGDVVYCVDPHKQNRWHLQLCAVLQEMLGLSNPPHFLIPCYTASIDRWVDLRTQQLTTVAEACPLVLRHRALLNVMFGLDDVVWAAAPCPEEVCDLRVLSSYRNQFPQLWQEHDLVVRFERVKPLLHAQDGGRSTLSWTPFNQKPKTQGYVLRLFVSGNTVATGRILQNLHQLLEKSLQQPYTLKVVDIYKHPELAEADQISATPTLVKVWPQPTRRIVGDLDDPHKVLNLLEASKSFSDVEI